MIIEDTSSQARAQAEASHPSLPLSLPFVPTYGIDSTEGGFFSLCSLDVHSPAMTQSTEIANMFPQMTQLLTFFWRSIYPQKVTWNVRDHRSCLLLLHSHHLDSGRRAVERRG